MKFLLAAFLVTLALTEAKYTSRSYAEYAVKYGKTHKTEDLDSRVIKWTRAKEFIDAHNARYDRGLESYTMTDNYFADLTDQEKERLTNAARPEPDRRSSMSVQFQSLDRGIPTSLNLTNSSCMPAIKNQGLCGGCYAFAALNPVEYQHCIKTGKKVSLSEQQVISCSQRFGNEGCSGGWYYNTWEYIYRVGGVASSSDYPFASKNGNLTRCTMANKTKIANVMTYAVVMGNETVIQQALATYGPISVSIAINDNFQYYSAGLYKDPECTVTVVGYHAITLVGYGTDEQGEPYWIARNSWGTRWGMQGYILMARNVNQCGLADYAAFPMYV